MPTPSHVAATASAPGRLRKVTLHAARCPQFPAGSDLHGYAFVAPLDADGRLDKASWRTERARCRAVRFWAGAPLRVGLLRRRPGGAGGVTWLLDFDPARSDDDEAGYRFDIHRFVEGEYVTLVDESGAQTFRIASVEKLDADAAARESCPTTRRMKAISA